MADQNTKCDLNVLRGSVAAARKELAKLRKDVKIIKEMFVKRFTEIEAILKCREVNKYAVNSVGVNERDGDSVEETVSGDFHSTNSEQQLIKNDNSDNAIGLRSQRASSCVIGHIKTCFKEKNGIPRQGSLCPLSKAVLCVDGVKEFTNSSHALEGLENFSHIWLLFLFHKNTNNSIKAKVRPPRLNGEKVGVFASRSPHRPSPIGLTLARLDNIEGNKLLLSGVDILDGTPILDIKPYIPDYDSVQSTDDCGDTCPLGYCKSETSKDIFKEQMSVTNSMVAENEVSTPQEDKLTTSPIHSVDEQHFNKEVRNDLSSAVISDWIRNPIVTPLSVSYTNKARANLEKFHNKNDFTSSKNHGRFQLELLSSSKDVEKAIEDILHEDPRSVYRRNRCPDEVYHFTIDKVNVSCVFSEDHVQVIDINPI